MRGACVCLCACVCMRVFACVCVRVCACVCVTCAWRPRLFVSHSVREVIPVCDGTMSHFASRHVIQSRPDQFSSIIDGKNRTDVSRRSKIEEMVHGSSIQRAKRYFIFTCTSKSGEQWGCWLGEAQTPPTPHLDPPPDGRAAPVLA